MSVERWRDLRGVTKRFLLASTREPMPARLIAGKANLIEDFATQYANRLVKLGLLQKTKALVPIRHLLWYYSLTDAGEQAIKESQKNFLEGKPNRKRRILQKLKHLGDACHVEELSKVLSWNIENTRESLILLTQEGLAASFEEDSKKVVYQITRSGMRFLKEFHRQNQKRPEVQAKLIHSFDTAGRLIIEAIAQVDGQEVARSKLQISIKLGVAGGVEVGEG